MELITPSILIKCLKLKNSEIVLTNRFQNKNSIKGWDIKRLLITKSGFT